MLNSSSHPKSLDRRDLLKTVALAGAGLWLGGDSRSLAEANKSKSPNERLNLPLIAFGGRAR
ncbi:MAG: twin-arginine translocation signal domain-containing protein, partial [Planctomycetes bacterium]|nr:twin-arginine translocation signal domain-containing protein [Planctomycetota bacterium]